MRQLNSDRRDFVVEPISSSRRGAVLPSLGTIYWRAVLRPSRRISKSLSRRGLYNFLEQRLSEIPAGARVLNVGVGGPVGEQVADYASRNRFNVLNMDIDASRKPELVGDIATYDFGGEKFDYIVMSEVLEHVQEPHLAARNLHSALADGGKLILSTPFIFPIHLRPHDYFRYTKYGLQYLFRDFKKVDVSARNTWPEAVVVLLARLSNEGGFLSGALTPLMILLALILQPVAWVLGRLFPADHLTTGYVLLAEK